MFGPVIRSVLTFSGIIQSFGTYKPLLTASTTGCLPSFILISAFSVKVGLTRLYSSAQTAREIKQSISLKISASFFKLKICSFTLSFNSLNKLYSKSIIRSSAFKIKASFSFKAGEIKRSQLVKV